MNMSVTNIGQNLAMDGRKMTTVKVYPAQTKLPSKVEDKSQEIVAAVAEDLATIRKNVSDLQNISDIFGGKLLFNINEELGRVVVKIVDPSTDKVIKEIPSADIQKLQVRIREAIGLLIDEKV